MRDDSYFVCSLCGTFKDTPDQPACSVCGTSFIKETPVCEITQEQAAEAAADDVAVEHTMADPVTEGPEGLFTDPITAMDYITGTNGRFTIKSLKTGKRYTFKVGAPANDRKGPMRFVGLLTDANNETDYQYLGFFKTNAADGPDLIAGRKGNAAHPAFKALSWVLRRLCNQPRSEGIPEYLEIWHEGRCCRCGRALTVPESIASGIGPECAKKEV